ncbi:hypothetical protein BH695_1502 [Microcystis aeruginosa PCC 7806SL]|uniref:Uncharacterized protein n=1 Tax=Microcystis aeruginosa PCC 7806SL TaxID=1903187 RepID=A0AB33BYY4_MICA7|nr:hypothetical protein BH695_1502 [Microcystis aeruginosa PCC 7806SL]
MTVYECQTWERGELHNSGFKSIAFTKLKKLSHKKMSPLGAFFGQENRYSTLIVLVLR